MAEHNLDPQHLAHLARLSLDTTQATRLSQKIQQVLQSFEALQAVDTSQVEPLTHPLAYSQPLRTDQVTASAQRELLQANAPEVQAGLFMVPQVIEEAN